MRHFSRPAGISNPGEGGATTGYIGVQRGTPGRRDLVQIGGGQNTFGVAGPAIGTDPNVVVGVGQGGAPQTILTGALQAPRTPGPYVLRLSGAKANGLNQVHAPPGFSTLQSAATQLDPGSIRFTVALLEAGDLNCDAVVDFGDINPFVLALSDPAGYHTQYPNCPIENGDRERRRFRELRGHQSVRGAAEPTVRPAVVQLLRSSCSHASASVRVGASVYGGGDSGSAEDPAIRVLRERDYARRICAIQIEALNQRAATRFGWPRAAVRDDGALPLRRRRSR